MNFDEWWNQDYDDSENPFQKDSFGYWAYAGWCAAMQALREESVQSEREWVGLTDEEITEAVGCLLDEVYLADFHKVIAKLKEKNICR